MAAFATYAASCACVLSSNGVSIATRRMPSAFIALMHEPRSVAAGVFVTLPMRARISSSNLQPRPAMMGTPACMIDCGRRVMISSVAAGRRSMPAAYERSPSERTTPSEVMTMVTPSGAMR